MSVVAQPAVGRARPADGETCFGVTDPLVSTTPGSQTRCAPRERGALRAVTTQEGARRWCQPLDREEAAAHRCSRTRPPSQSVDAGRRAASARRGRGLRRRAGASCVGVAACGPGRTSRGTCRPCAGASAGRSRSCRAATRSRTEAARVVRKGRDPCALSDRRSPDPLRFGEQFCDLARVKSCRSTRRPGPAGRAGEQPESSRATGSAVDRRGRPHLPPWIVWSHVSRNANPCAPLMAAGAPRVAKSRREALRSRLASASSDRSVDAAAVEESPASGHRWPGSERAIPHRRHRDDAAGA